MTMRFTDELIAQLAPPARGYFIVFDSDRRSPPGFGVRVTAKGTRSFVIRYQWAGADRLLTIRQHLAAKKPWSLSTVRAEAWELRRKIEAGLDPKKREAGSKATCDRGITVGEAVHSYLRELRVRNVRPRDASYFRREVLPVIGKQRLEDVVLKDLMFLVRRVGKRGHPVAALGLVAALRTFLGWAQARGCIAKSPVEKQEYAVMLGGFSTRSRDRVLSDAEIRGFWHKIDTCGVRTMIALALKLILVTGQRPTEVVGMKWSEVNRENSVWRIPAARRGRVRTAHRVPLSDLALTILDAAKAESVRLAPGRGGLRGPYVFAMLNAQPVTRQHLANISRYHHELGNCGPNPWRPADLRETCRKHLLTLGIQENTADAVMGHSIADLPGNPDSSWLDATRYALDRWAAELRQIVSG